MSDEQVELTHLGELFLSLGELFCGSRRIVLLISANSCAAAVSDEQVELAHLGELFCESRRIVCSSRRIVLLISVQFERTPEAAHLGELFVDLGEFFC